MMYLGIEIGGTKLQLGVGPGDGTLAALWRDTVNVAAGPEGIRRQIVAGVTQLLAKVAIDRSRLRGAGIGFGGPVDDSTHTVIKSHQIEGWDNFPLARWIEEVTGLPAVLGNDADVAGLAEALFGAGKGLSPVFYITVGSGIGGGLIINGEIYRGCGRGGAEIGHLRVPVQSNGGFWRVTLEDAASGWGIEDEARNQSIDADWAKQVLFLAKGRRDQITARHVAEAAAQGDPFAQRILERARETLAEGMCQVVALVCPRRFVIGGGISLMGEELFLRPLRALVAERVFGPFAGCYDIVSAQLGEEVVVHGALVLAHRRFKN
jgi:glucokinase